MAVGPSGRVVIDVDPEFKREFYAALQKEGKSVKDWFIENATRFLETHGQLDLALRPKTEPSK